MPFHQSIQDLILLGHRPALPPPPARADAPSALRDLIEVVASEHRALNEMAIRAGHRYRSAFWALYLLSSLAVLLAVLPVALGWADHEHRLHHFSVLWSLAEVVVIGAAWLLYRRGIREDWQGQWLEYRSRAELVWYLPVAACLRAERPAAVDGNWYDELFGVGDEDAEVTRLCRRLEVRAREALAGVWRHEDFVADFGIWIQAVLAGQQHYQKRLAQRHTALQHRVHGITAALFGLSAAAAGLHLFWHEDLLLIATTAFPALAAALHGALVQGESHRLAEAAQQLDHQLAVLDAELVLARSQSTPAERGAAVYRAAFTALNLILREHQDWRRLVRPHHLPLG